MSILCMSEPEFAYLYTYTMAEHCYFVDKLKLCSYALYIASISGNTSNDIKLHITPQSVTQFIEMI